MKIFNVKNIRFVCFFILLAMAASSCKRSFLEIEPRGKLIARKLQDYDLLFNNLNLLNTDVNTNVPMGDEVVALEPFFSGADIRTQRLFRWDDVIYEPNENSRELSVLMLQLYTYNKIIREVPDVPDGSEAQKQSLLAEARANRAWSHFMLVNYYTKPYNPATAATDLGFPIVTAADVTTRDFVRPSVQENYDFIVRELTESIPHLPKNPIVRARMPRGGAKALLGKVYMFMGEYEQALKAFNEAFLDLPNQYVVELIDYNVTTAPTGTWKSNPNSNITGMPAGWVNTENLIVKQFSNTYSNTSNFMLVGPRTLSLFKADDCRLFFYSANANGGTVLPDGVKRRNGPAQAQFGLLLSDMYLLRAEAKVRTNDLSGALSDLEAFRTKRMPAASAKVELTQKEAIIRFIIDERIREFAVLGYRWHDMRRLSVDPLFASTVYTHQLIGQSGQITEFTLRPERFVLQFPEKVMLENPGMQNNP